MREQPTLEATVPLALNPIQKELTALANVKSGPVRVYDHPNSAPLRGVATVLKPFLLKFMMGSGGTSTVN